VVPAAALGRSLTVGLAATDLRQAMVLVEVLGRPVALRESGAGAA